MRTLLNSIAVSGAGVLAVFLMMSAPVPGQAQAAKGKTAKAAPRLPNGKPDLTGVWDHPRVGDFSKDFQGCVGGTQGCSAKADTAEFPWTAAGKAANEADPKFDYGVHCLPWGYVRSYGTPYPIELIQKDHRLAVLFEQNKWFHIVPTDGRPLKVEYPTWMGWSVGHWEGDTLVVETEGTNGKTWIDTAEHPHSDALKVVERWTRPDFDHIVHEVTITDPKFLTKPMKNTSNWVLMAPGTELYEYSCEENNKEIMDGHIKDEFTAGKK